MKVIKKVVLEARVSYHRNWIMLCERAMKKGHLTELDAFHHITVHFMRLLTAYSELVSLGLQPINEDVVKELSEIEALLNK